MIARRRTGDRTGRRARVAACLLVAGVLLLHASPARAQATTVLRQPSARLVRNVIQREGVKRLATYRFIERPLCDTDEQPPACKSHQADVVREVRALLGARFTVKENEFSISPLMSSPNGLFLMLYKSGPTDMPKYRGLEAVEFRIAADGETVTARTIKFSELYMAR